MELFSAHLRLLKVNHTMSDLPNLIFEPVDEETRLDKMRRATLGYDAGVLTLNQALEVVDLGTEEGGDTRKEGGTRTPTGELPREGEM